MNRISICRAFRGFKLLCFSFIPLFISCTSKDTGNESIVASPINIEVEIDSVSIPIDSTLLSGYTIYTSQKQYDTFIGYNDAFHKMDFFDLKRKKFIKSIPLEKEGPNGVSEIYSFVMGNRGEMVLLTTQSITLLDSTGQVKKKVPVNMSSGNELFRNNALYPFSSHNFFFNPDSETIYCSNVSYVYGLCDPRHYEAPIVASVNLNTAEVKLFPIFYPKEFTENSFGFLDEIGFCFSDDFNKLLYNFLGSSDIYEYDLISNSTTLIKRPSSYTKNEPSTLSWDRCENFNLKTKHFMENAQFQKIRSSAKGDLYFRLHAKEMVYERGPDNKYPSMGSRLNYLSIYDDQMKFVKELELGNAIFPNWSFVGSQGLYTTPILYEKEDELRFIVYKINRID